MKIVLSSDLTERKQSEYLPTSEVAELGFEPQTV